MIEWNQRTMSVVQPLLDYMAPEYVVGGRCDPCADMYSFGIMALTIFNKGKQPFDNGNSLDTFRKNTEKVIILGSCFSCCYCYILSVSKLFFQLNTLPASMFANVPAELCEDIKMCLNLTPDFRPDATQFSKVIPFMYPSYFSCAISTHT